VSESDKNTSSVMLWSVMFSPYSHTAKSTSMQFGTQQTQHLLTLWFKNQQCLPFHMLLLLRGNRLKCSVEDTHKYEPTVQKSREEILPTELRIFASVPYYTNQRNKCLYSFLFTPNDCIWTNSPQHPEKPAPPWHLPTSL
jgi:hypothetical protein